MAGFSANTYGQRVALSPRAGLGNNKATTTAPTQALTKYGTPLPVQAGAPNPGSMYQSEDANQIRNLATAYTPEQMLQMKTAATNTNAAGARGMTDRLRELMAAQGISGSGAEAGRLQSAMLGNNANLANQMSNIDISNAQTDLSNRYQKAGMLGGLMNMGLNENQFNQGLYSDLYKWGNEFDYRKGQDKLSNQQYQDQLNQMMKLYGGSTSNNNYAKLGG